MAGLTKRNNIYYITWREGGRVRKKSTGTKNKTRAERMRANFESDNFQGVDDRFAQYRKRSIAEHLDEYHEFQIATKITQKQADQVKMRVSRIFEDAKVRYILDLTESRIRIAISNLRLTSQRRTMKTDEMPVVSPRTRNSYLRAVLQFCNWLVRDRRMSENPLRGMKAENVQVEIRHERTSLLEHEFKLLYETTNRSTEVIEGYDGKIRALIYLLAYTSGLRKGEIASLTPKSFRLDKEKPTVTIEAAYSKRRRRDTIVLPKGIVPLLDFTDLKPDDVIFSRLKGRKTNKMIRRDLESSSIAYQTENGKFRDFHSLRHTFITQLWVVGASPNVAQSLARHSDLRQTMGYSHVTREEQHEIVDKLPGIPKS